MFERLALLAVAVFAISPVSAVGGEGGARGAFAGPLTVPRPALLSAVRNSALVVEGAPRKFRGRSSHAVFAVASSLKGDADPKKSIIVDFEKAPYGLWPKRGQRALLCLDQVDGKTTYELTSYSASVLPATDRMKSTIRAILVPGEADDVLSRDETTPVDETPKVSDPGPTNEVESPRIPLMDEYAERVAESETILVGALTGVSPTSDGFVGRFSVTEAVVGYAAFKVPVRVDFRAQGRALKRPPPAGRYVLFLRGSEAGDGFEVVSRESGAVRVATPEWEAKIKRAVVALAKKGAVGNRLGLTTIQATVAEWQDAWNARDLERCIRCYSARSALRIAYDSGSEGRNRLLAQIKGYAGYVKLSIQRVERSRTYGRGRARGHGAVVAALLTLSPAEAAGPDGQANATGGSEQRRSVEMKFVNEEDEWLILEEGF